MPGPLTVGGHGLFRSRALLHVESGARRERSRAAIDSLLPAPRARFALTISLHCVSRSQSHPYDRRTPHEYEHRHLHRLGFA